MESVAKCHSEIVLFCIMAHIFICLANCRNFSSCNLCKHIRYPQTECERLLWRTNQINLNMTDYRSLFVHHPPIKYTSVTDILGHQTHRGSQLAWMAMNLNIWNGDGMIKDSESKLIHCLPTNSLWQMRAHPSHPASQPSIRSHWTTFL